MFWLLSFQKKTNPPQFEYIPSKYILADAALRFYIKAFISPITQENWVWLDHHEPIQATFLGLQNSGGWKRAVDTVTTDGAE